MDNNSPQNNQDTAAVDKKIAEENARIYGFSESNVKRSSFMADFAVLTKKRSLYGVAGVVVLVTILSLIVLGNAHRSPKSQTLVSAAASDTASDPSDVPLAGDYTIGTDDNTNNTSTNNVTSTPPKSVSASPPAQVTPSNPSSRTKIIRPPVLPPPTIKRPVPPPPKPPTPKPPVPKPPTPTPPPAVSSQFTISSWNTRFDNSASNLGDQVKLVAGGASILGLQEVHNPTKRKQIQSKVLCSSCAYAGYVRDYTYNGSSPASIPIIWKKTEFSLSGSGSYISAANRVSGFNDCTSSHEVSSKWMTWVKLKNLKTGRYFYVLNTHTGAGIESGGKPNTCNSERVNQYKTQMNAMMSKISELKKAGLPIFITGDFNVNYRRDITVKNSIFPYYRMKQYSIHSGYELLNLKGIPSSKGSQGANDRIIDYVFSLTHSAVKANSIRIANGSYGSDHFPVFLTLTLTK